MTRDPGVFLNSSKMRAGFAPRSRLLVITVTIYVITINLWTWGMAIPVALAGRGDFRQFYAAGAMVRTGHRHQLYDYETQKEFQDRLVSSEQAALPFVSPAYDCLFFAGLSVLSYRQAYFLFFGLNIVVLALCFVLLKPWTRNLRLYSPWLPFALFTGFEPLTAALVQGQDSILLTALLTGAFVFMTRQQNFAAGLLAGLGLFKFSITLPIALLFLIWQRWRFLAGFATSATTLVAVSVVISGIAQTKLYLASLFAIAGLRPPVSNLSRYPITLPQMANVHGFVFGIGSNLVSRSSLLVLTILCSVAVLGWTARHGRYLNEPALLLLAIPCSILVSHHTYVHDLSPLLLPAAILLSCYSRDQASHDRNAQLMRGSAALIFATPVLESLSPRRFFVVALVIALFLKAVAAAANGALGRTSWN